MFPGSSFRPQGSIPNGRPPTQESQNDPSSHSRVLQNPLTASTTRSNIHGIGVYPHSESHRARSTQAGAPPDGSSTRFSAPSEGHESSSRGQRSDVQSTSHRSHAASGLPHSSGYPQQQSQALVSSRRQSYDHRASSSSQHQSSRIPIDGTDPGMYLQRSSQFEAQIHANNDFFSHHIQQIYHYIEELQQEVHTLTGENTEIRAELVELRASLDQESLTGGSGGSKSKKKAVKGVANQNPEAKSLLHAMFWRLLGIDPNLDAEERHEKMTEDHDNDAGFILINGPGGESKVWMPNYSQPLNTRKNKVFIAEIVDRLYETEQRNRTQSKGQLPDASFDKAILKSMAQTYFSTIATAWRKMQTEEGKEKLGDAKENKKLRARRETVTAARRNVVDEFQEHFNVEGAGALLDTDFASSVISLDEKDISDATKTRRKERGGRAGDWMVCGKNWQRKKYVRFLRELDRFIVLKETAKTDAKKAKTANQQPAQKRQRQNPKKITTRFYGTVTKFSDRAPASRKKNPIIPITGMVKKSWMAGEKGEKIATLDDPDWWEMWEDDAEPLDSDTQALLDELPSDSEPETVNDQMEED
ncbi:hypothetical protein C8R43DRAFT_1134927 [Mycena crocata]|nr:hypothetical protein C8R43DRAFT_1134927 [Mycena crocata]